MLIIILYSIHVFSFPFNPINFNPINSFPFNKYIYIIFFVIIIWKLVYRKPFLNYPETHVICNLQTNLQWLEYPYALKLENPILKISRKPFFNI